VIVSPGNGNPRWRSLGGGGVACELVALLQHDPVAEILASMPRVGAQTAVALLLTLGDGGARSEDDA
jgi:hypothetical protein